MKIRIDEPLHIAKLYVKALPLDENKKDVVIGACDWSYISNQYTVRDSRTKQNIIVNPYTICRNSCITDKNGRYIYEYDLLKLKRSGFADCYGYLVWEEFYKAWKIRKFTEYGGASDVGSYTVEVVGNVILNDADAEIIYKQDEEELKREGYIDTSDCRPSHKIKQKKW